MFQINHIPTEDRDCEEKEKKEDRKKMLKHPERAHNAVVRSGCRMILEETNESNFHFQSID